MEEGVRREGDPDQVATNSEWTGFVKPDGEAEIIDDQDRQDASRRSRSTRRTWRRDLKPCVEAQLLADADRFYLILDRDPSAGSTNGTSRVPVYNNYMLRTQKVNGPLYAFDRGTGKRLWCYGDGLLENQWLVLEQFADLPVIIAAGAGDATQQQPRYQLTRSW